MERNLFDEERFGCPRSMIGSDTPPQGMRCGDCFYFREVGAQGVCVWDVEKDKHGRLVVNLEEMDERDPACDWWEPRI